MAGDAVSLSECFAPGAQLTTALDPKLVRRLGAGLGQEPIQAIGQLEIMKYYALEFAAYEVTRCDVVSAIDLGREIGLVYEWGIVLRDSGATLTGACHSITTLDARGRKIVASYDLCKVLTSDWDRYFH